MTVLFRKPKAGLGTVRSDKGEIRYPVRDDFDLWRTDTMAVSRKIALPFSAITMTRADISMIRPSTRRCAALGSASTV